jgi:hypothetical protein
MFNNRKFNIANIYLILYLLSFGMCILSITTIINNPIVFAISLSSCMLFLIIFFKKLSQ